MFGGIQGHLLLRKAKLWLIYNQITYCTYRQKSKERNIQRGKTQQQHETWLKGVNIIAYKLKPKGLCETENCKMTWTIQSFQLIPVLAGITKDNANWLFGYSRELLQCYSYTGFSRTAEREVTPCYLALEVRENVDRLGVDSVLVFKFRSSSDGGFCSLNPVFVQLVIATGQFRSVRDILPHSTDSLGIFGSTSTPATWEQSGNYVVLNCGFAFCKHGVTPSQLRVRENTVLFHVLEYRLWSVVLHNIFILIV